LNLRGGYRWPDAPHLDAQIRRRIVAAELAGPLSPSATTAGALVRARA
jgi:hypothetical protein